MELFFSFTLDSIYTKHRKSSFLSLENPWKLVESYFITAPNVKSMRINISGGSKFELKSLIVKIEHNVPKFGQFLGFSNYLKRSKVATPFMLYGLFNAVS